MIGLPVAWLVAEFSERRSLRIALGAAALATATLAAYQTAGLLSRLKYNAWYGTASKELVETTIEQVEDGNIDRVLGILRRLDLDYQPTYENRAHYNELVTEAVVQMAGDDDLQGTKWDSAPFSRDTWIGHWENETGFWIVINHVSDFQIVRSGDNMPAMTDVIVAEDYKSLSFTEGDQWRHELTLVNKYQATHVWHKLEGGSVRQTETLHKLIRATPEQRVFTQQAE